jgi:sulfatase maturation enzyme AslB (radical SAM superfamily)
MKVRYGATGVHMFERNSGLNVLLDEVAVPAEKWSVAPTYISFALTNSCELSCSYCFAPKFSAHLPAASVRSWVRDLDAGGCFGVGFGGGEPTLYPGFAALCRDLHQETQLAITMTTHGHRFSGSLARELTGNLEFIRLSMDGIGDTYERLRGRSFTVFQEKLRIVRDTARFGINYVVNDDTIDDLASAADFAFANGAEQLLLLPETGQDLKPLIGAETMRRLTDWVREHHSYCRLAISAHSGVLMDVPILPVSDTAHGSYEFMHVDAAGILKLSAFTQSGVSLADSPSILDSVRMLHLSEQKDSWEVLE